MELVLLGAHLPPSSLWLALFSAVCLCDSSLQPAEPNEPLRISASEGALDATLPVAAHIPAGGVASMSFMLAVRMRLEVEVVDALVEVRARRVVGELEFWGGESG